MCCHLSKKWNNWWKNGRKRSLNDKNLFLENFANKSWHSVWTLNNSRVNVFTFTECFLLRRIDMVKFSRCHFDRHWRWNITILTPFWFTKNEDEKLWFFRGKAGLKFTKFQVITWSSSWVSFLLGFLKVWKKKICLKK